MRDRDRQSSAGERRMRSSGMRMQIRTEKKRKTNEMQLKRVPEKTHARRANHRERLQGPGRRQREMMSDRQRDRESWSELQCDSGNDRTHSIKIKVF